MPVLLLYIAAEEADAHVQNQIRALAPELRIVVTQERAEVEALLDEIEIAAGHVPPDLMLRAPALRWFHQWSAGSDWLLRNPQAAEQAFLLTTSSGVHAIPISEQIIGMLLMFARGLHHAVRAQAQQTWWRPKPQETFELAGKTMLLIGVGAIGGRTAQLATALGMTVEGIRRNPEQAVAGVSAMYGLEQLHERLAHADVVVLTLPLSRATQGLIGRDELRCMKPTAYFVNIGRGGIVDEPALIEALTEQRIAGAALDVFAQEPLPPTSPFWTMDNVIMTAHYAGVNRHYGERAMAIFLDNLERFRAGTPLRNLVDKRTGY